jgi:DNA-binding transcriptional LysR family regulator
VLDLTRREADIALRTVRPTRGDLIVLRIASVRWLPVAAPKVAAELGTLRKWQQAGWVGWGERLSHIGPARWLAARLQDTEPLVRSDSLLAQLAVLAAGVGVGLVPEPSAKHYGLVPVKLSAALRAEAGDWPENDLFIVTHRALRDVPRVRAVWDLIVERTASRLAGGLSGPA